MNPGVSGERRRRVDLDCLDPELLAYADEPLDLSDPEVLRAARATLAAFPETPVPGVVRTGLVRRDLRSRIYRSNRPGSSGLIWFHGGALVGGSPAMDDEFCARTAAELGVTVLSIDYRLAPEQPFPAALDDARWGWRWFTAHAAKWGVDTDSIAVGGQSAGGCLAAGLVQWLIDAGERPAAQWLWSPMLDDRTAADRSLDDAGHAVFDNRANRWAWSAYLGTSPGAETVPAYASPGRRRDLTGMPPTFIATSDADLFYAEDLAYAARLQDAGVAVELDVTPGAPHGFEAQGRRSAAADRVLQAGRDWLRATLARATAASAR